MSSKSASQVVNSVLLEQLATPGLQKQAEDALNSFTRSEMREEGAFRKILPMSEIGDDELDAQIGTDSLVKIFWKEPGSPGAMSVPFAGSPRAFFIRGSNYPLYFSNIIGPKHIKDINELRVYPYDIRQVLTDHAIRDVQEEEDKRWFTDGIDAAMVGVNQVSPFTNRVQWSQISGGWTRGNVVQAMKSLPSGTTKTKADTCVINSVTVHDFQKWGRDEWGGDMSQDILKNGRAEGSWLVGDFMQARWLVTIKHNLVPDGSLYCFSTPEYIGKSCSLMDITMYIERRGTTIEFYPYETIGAAIGNVGGFTRTDII